MPRMKSNELSFDLEVATAREEAPRRGADLIGRPPPLFDPLMAIVRAGPAGRQRVVRTLRLEPEQWDGGLP